MLRTITHSLAGQPGRALELIDEVIIADAARVGDSDLLLAKGDFQIARRILR